MKLTQEVITEKLKELYGWQYVHNGIEKNYVFNNFIEAFGFMSRVALLAEKYDHHPDWSGVHNTVKIRLNTHEVDGITANDIEMATKIDENRKFDTI